MNLRAILARSLKVIWQYPALLILGMVAALGFAGFGYLSWPPQSSLNVFDLLLSSTPSALSRLLISISSLPTMLGWVYIALFISVVLWGIGIVISGGMVAGVEQIETQGRTSVRNIVVAGRSRFMSLLGFSLLCLPVFRVLSALAVVMMLFSAFVAISVLSLGFVTTAISQDQKYGTTYLFIAGIVLVGTTFWLLTILIEVVNAFQMLAERAIVIEKLGVNSAIRRAWQLLRCKTSHIAWLVVTMMATDGVFGVIVVGLQVASHGEIWKLLFEAADKAVMDTGTMNLEVNVMLLGFGIWAIWFTVFRSVVWTLAYRSMVMLPSVSTVSKSLPISADISGA